MIALLLAGLGLAADHATDICADVERRLRDPAAIPEDIASFLAKDDRLVTPPVLECLCVIGAPPEVHREARRRVLRDTVAIDAASWPIATQDPLTSPSFQVAVLLGRRLEAAAGRSQPFVVLPTRLEGPAWFELEAAVRALREFEVPGARLPTSGWLEDQGVAAPPRGALAGFEASGALDRFDLSSLLGTMDRALWLDIGPAEDGTPTLSWVMARVTATRPHPRLAADSVSLSELPAPMVASCEAPLPATQRLWKAKLAWPAERVAAVTVGAAVAAVFGGLAASDFAAFQQADPGDPDNPDRVTRNVAFGAVGIAGGVLATVGFAVPGRAWRR